MAAKIPDGARTKPIPNAVRNPYDRIDVWVGLPRYARDVYYKGLKLMLLFPNLFAPQEQLFVERHLFLHYALALLIGCADE